MKKEKFLNILKYSLILGGVLGLISLVPIVRVVSFLIMACCASIFIFIYMKKTEQIKDLTIKGASITGAVIGFVNLAGFLVVFLPLNALLGTLPFKIADFYAWSKFLLGIWWLLLIMGGLVTSLFNSFFLLSYIYIRDTYFMIEGKKDIELDFTPKERR